MTQKNHAMGVTARQAINAENKVEELFVESKVVEIPVNPMQSLNDKLACALSIDTNSLFTTIKTTDSELEVMKKTYQFANPIGKRDSMTIYDTSIIESMEKISHALHGKAILTYAICKEFSKIAESGKLENMGFKTIADFGKAVYGLETSTVNHYTRIGTTFINDDYSVKAGLPDLSVSHFIELSSSVNDGDITPIIELYTNGTLVDGMSTKRIRETLKTLASGSVIEEKSSNANTTAKNDNVGETIPNVSDVTELEANFDSQVVIGKIIGGCTVIEQMFDMLTKNDIKAIGYADHIDALKAIAKALL